jgi:hypothetical protein
LNLTLKPIYYDPSSFQTNPKRRKIFEELPRLGALCET